MIGVTPANNFLGHGFYQFSPELFFRIFSDSNGFELEKMYLFFPYPDSPVYEVSDPLSVRDRVKFKNSEETFLFYIAKRVSIKPIFQNTPQQSDYEHILWENEAKPATAKVGLKRFVPDMAVASVLKLRKYYLDFRASRRPFGSGNPAYFKKVKL